MSYIIKRELLDELKNDLENKEISLIVGPRQSGKTTLMEKLDDFVSKKGKKSVWFSLDSGDDRDLFESQAKLLQEIGYRIGEEGVIFIDEIQRKKNAGLFLKGIYDQVQHEGLGYKFIVSGSGSLELKEKIHESLAGRKILFELGTVSFKEFLDFKTDYAYGGDLLEFSELRKDSCNTLFEEYLNFGGYPKVVLSETYKKKQKVIKEIYQSYISKDVSDLLGVDRVDAFDDMIKLLAVNPGRLINHSKLASSINISVPTFKKYVWYAEKTFVVNRLKPYFRNKKKEIVKSPKLYFHDLGFMSFASGHFGEVLDWSSSFFFENLVFNLLRRKLEFTGKDLRFWRTKSGSEVDFLISSMGGKRLIPVEVKFSKLGGSKIGRSLHSFIDKYNPDKVFVVNLSLDEETEVRDTKVRFIPFVKFVFEKDLL